MQRTAILTLLLILFTAPLSAQQTIDELREAAFELYNAGEYAEVVPLLAEEYDREDSDWRIYHIYAIGIKSLGNLDSAVAILEEGIARFPAEGVLYAERGHMLRDLNRPIDAIASFEAGITAAPTAWLNYFYAANLYYSSNDFVWAIIYYELALMMSDNNQARMMAAENLKRAYADALPERIPGGGWHIQAMTDEHGEANGVMLFGVQYLKTLTEAADAVGYEPSDAPTAEDLAAVRTKFTELWFAQDSYPEVPLFDLYRQIAEAGHLETYNFMILLADQPDAWQAWATPRMDEVRTTAEFMMKTDPPIGKEVTFNRDAMRAFYAE